MKLGLGFYRHMLTRDNFRFAKQAGATHIVAHLTDYFGKTADLSTGSGLDAWGVAGGHGLWTYEYLRDLRAAINAEGLELAALENFDPAFWYDVLLDGPKKKQQMEDIKTLIRDIGRAGIPIMGYNFSIAGVWGRVNGAFARGDAESVGFLSPEETPIPNGMVWNMIYDANAPAGTLAPVTSEELWQRYGWFMDEIIPVAEEAGVMMAAHPDDPPLPTLRGAARLVYQPAIYQRLLDLKPSRANGLEFCIGTLAEMQPDDLGDIYNVVDHYSKQGKIGYVHFRNVRGKVPNYYEVFVDEGDVDMIRVMQILQRNGFEGVLIPDHTPQMACDAPWHAGMAYAMGYMRAVMRMLEAE